MTADDDAFRALADPTRRLLLDRLLARNGQTLHELCAELTMARQSASKHLAVLERANLVTTTRQGREKCHFLNVEPINAIAARWMNSYDRHRATAVDDLKKTLEDSHMPTTEFVYTTYIRAGVDAVWAGLTSREFTRRYWGVELESDWRPGSLIVWHERGATIKDPEQVVLECDRPRRLAYTWHTFNMEWARTHGFEADLVDQLSAEPRSTVTFDLHTEGDVVKLTLTHTFGPAKTLREMCSQGWPRLLADLKTLLETGDLANEVRTT